MQQDCIIFAGATDRKGYGRRNWKRANGKWLVAFAHRVALIQSMGVTLESIDDMQVRHRCDTPACVNPDHLELGSNQDNVTDMMQRGRNRPGAGERHGHTHLKEADVLAMRSRYVRGSRTDGTGALARDYGISDCAAWNIINRLTWANI